MKAPFRLILTQEIILRGQFYVLSKIPADNFKYLKL